MSEPFPILSYKLLNNDTTIRHYTTWCADRGVI